MVPGNPSSDSRLRQLLAASQAAYDTYCRGQGSLEALYNELSELIVELERCRLAKPHGTPSLLFLGRFDVYETAAALAYSLGLIREALDHAERARARNLLDKSLNKLAIDSKRLRDSDLLRREIALNQEVAELSRHSHATVSTGNGKGGDVRPALRSAAEGNLALEHVRNELLAVRRAIQERDPAYAALRGVTPASLEDVQALVDRASAILSYCVTAERVIVFVITCREFRAEHFNITSDQLSVLVDRYRGQIKRFGMRRRDAVLGEAVFLADDHSVSGQELDALSEQLYGALIRPVEAHISGKSRLGIVPHGDLHFLPFQALWSDQGYLIERFGIWYAPSLSLMDLCHQRQRRSKNRLLALGNPNLGNPALDLPFAEQEVLAIATLFDSRTYLGPKAKLEALEAHWNECDLLHLACHAFWDAQEPGLSALLLTPGEHDSGRLDTQALFALDHDLPVSQVTLSACNTSLGAGSDLTGLATGFLYAGAASVVASLWSVDDFSTSELMRAFYLGLTDTDRAEALRGAQLKLLNYPEYAHPYFWAAFKLIGSPLPIDSDRAHTISAFNLIHRWTYRSADGYLLFPATDGTALFSVWLERDEEKRDDLLRHSIFAVTLENRRLCWERKVADSARAFCFQSGLVHVEATSKVCALRSSDGEAVWQRETGSRLRQSLFCSGGLLYIGGRSRSVYALRPETGDVVWEHQLPRPASGGFALGAGLVFVGCNDHHLHALDAQSGQVVWRSDLGYADWERGAAWLEDGRLWTALGSFDLKTGQLQEQKQPVPPFAVDGRLLLEKTKRLPRNADLELEGTFLRLNNDFAFLWEKSDNGLLSMFDAEDGRLLRSYRLGPSKITGICRTGDLVIVGDGDGALHGFSVEKAKGKAVQL